MATISWDIEPPEREKAALGGRKPRGALVIHDGGVEGSSERITVPAAVAKSLKSHLDGLSGEPSSRAELLYHVRLVCDECAMARLTRLVDRRDYSSKEATEKLRLDGYPVSCIERVMGRALFCGMVDDARFADVFIRTKVASGWGAVRIERELSRRGVDVGMVEGWPHEFLEPEDESQRAYELVSTRRIPSKNAYPKLVRFLVSRGFSIGDATAAVRRRLEESEE